MSYLSNLIKRRDAVAQELADLDETKAGGKPNVKGIQGQVDHVEYRKSLLEELKYLDKQINQAAGAQEYITEEYA